MTRTQVIKAIEAEVRADAEDAVFEATFNEAVEFAMTLLEYPYNVSYRDIKNMDKDARRALRHDLDKILDGYPDDYTLWDKAYVVYEDLNEIEDEEYREANMDSFRAYEAKMNEPDFDWAFYSDWHKDMFGYRPHFHVIPQTETEREAMFHGFHALRGC